MCCTNAFDILGPRTISLLEKVSHFLFGSSAQVLDQNKREILILSKDNVLGH